MDARDIDRKLRVTAAALGVVTRKDLAAAFRRVNVGTTFDVERANKWLQGRARPRELKLYEDWAKVLDLGRSGQWIAECEMDAFLDAIARRFGTDRDTLDRRARDTERRRDPSRNGAETEPDTGLAGTFIGYSHASSPYFRGQLICGELSLRADPNARQLVASYEENLPTGPLVLEGPVTSGQRTLTLDLHTPDRDVHFSMSLIRPAPPVSVLVGYLSGAAFLSSETELATTRIVFVRIPAAARRRTGSAYLPANTSFAADLAGLGLPLQDPAAADERLARFLMAGHERGIDRIGADQHRALTELFDRNWLAQVVAAPTGAAPALTVVAGPGRALSASRR